jgi:hypothetical protein
MPLTDTHPDGYQTTTTILPAHNTDEENAQLLAWHEDQRCAPGHMVRFDYRATPEIADRVRHLLHHRYGWTIELERQNRYWMRKPKMITTQFNAPRQYR